MLEVSTSPSLPTRSVRAVTERSRRRDELPDCAGLAIACAGWAIACAGWAIACAGWAIACAGWPIVGRGRRVGELDVRLPRARRLDARRPATHDQRDPEQLGDLG
jgi:hypothetical protein